MASTWVSKYGTKINISGLTPEQIKQVQSTAQDKGAYGSKAASLADSFRKKATAATPAAGAPAAAPVVPQTPMTGTPTPGGTPNLGVDPKTGAVDPGAATTSLVNASVDDTTKTFNLQNPGAQTDALGNKQDITFDPTTGKTSITQKAGQGLSAVNTAFTNAATGLGTDGRAKAQDAAYGYITKTYQRDKARELEDAKQELANRGIPLDPSPNSLYGKAISSIEEKYQGLDDQAKSQALTAGNQYYSTDVNAVSTLGSTVAGQTPNFTQYQGGTSTLAPNMQAALQSIAGFNMQKYQTDKEYKARMDQIAVQRLAASKSGSGGGGGDEGGDIFLG